MPNGSTVYGGRAVGSIFAGRALSAVRMANGGPQGRSYQAFPGSGLDWPAFPRSGLCTPIIQCCCKTFTAAPGEITPLLMRFDAWLQSEAAQGFQLHEVDSARLLDMGKHPVVAADPDIIKITSGKPSTDPPDNSDVAHLFDLLPPTAIRAFIEVAPDATIGSQYKLDVCLTACSGCDGQIIRQCDCVAINIAEC